MYFLLDSTASIVETISSSPSNWGILLALIISILSPLFHSYLNNRHQLKMKQIDLLFQKKQEAYLQFAESFFAFSKFNNPDNFRKLEASINKCRLLCRNKDFEIASYNLLHFASADLIDYTCENFFKECLDILSEDLKGEESNLF